MFELKLTMDSDEIEVWISRNERWLKRINSTPYSLQYREHVDVLKKVLGTTSRYGGGEGQYRRSLRFGTVQYFLATSRRVCLHKLAELHCWKMKVL
jgi:hypothetical protein